MTVDLQVVEVATGKVKQTLAGVSFSEFKRDPALHLLTSISNIPGRVSLRHILSSCTILASLP